MSSPIRSETVHCREAEDLAARLAGLSAAAVSLRPKSRGGTLSALVLGDVSIQVLRSAPMLMLASPSPDRTTLLKATEGFRRARWNGTPVTSGRIMICDGSRQHEAVYPDDFACLLVSFGAAANDRIAVRAPDPERPDGDLARAAALRELDRVSQALEQGFGGTPELLGNTEAARGLQASILDAVAAILPSSEPITRRSAACSRARQHLVHAVDDYLRANPARPVYTEELCTALGTSATRLHQAFHATFGMSPHRYLKLRRMAMVRAMLLSRSGPWSSVKAAALSHGFWHLGQFAHDYRDIYGELPSETLARGRAIPDGVTPFDLDDV